MKAKPNDLTHAGAGRNSFDDLQQALHLAVKLELFTIPYYFYTFYSLREPTSPMGVRLREVIMEEMLHLAIISNIMHAIKGCSPPAYSPIKKLDPCDPKLIRKYVPIYPGYAPIYRPAEEIKEEGDLRNNIPKDAPCLHLDSLTKEQIVAFLRLELPELRKTTDPLIPGWQTIGEFYDYVKTQLLSCTKLEFNSKNQIDLYTHNPTKERNTMSPVRNLKDALDNIDFIVEQGEGATFYNLAKHDEKYKLQKDKRDALVATEIKKTELAHFYHFLLIYEDMGGEATFSIETQEFDEKVFRDKFDDVKYDRFRNASVINLVKDPAKALDKYPRVAEEANRIFNSNYSRMLDRLTCASVDDHRLNFGIALEQMTKFDELADKVKEYTLEGDSTTYCGPTFEYICPKLSL